MRRAGIAGPGGAPMIRAAVLAALLLAQAAGAASLYKVVGPDGKVTFTDQPPAPAEAKLVKGVASSAPARTDDPAAAAGQVYAMQVVVETGTQFCTTYVLGSSRDVLKARARWRERNGEIIDKKNRVLRDTIGLAAMHALGNKMERENETMLDKMRKASASDQQQWCAQAPANFEASHLDPSRTSSLVKTIMDYKLK